MWRKIEKPDCDPIGDPNDYIYDQAELDYDADINYEKIFFPCKWDLISDSLNIKGE